MPIHIKQIVKLFCSVCNACADNLIIAAARGVMPWSAP